jgi:disulfide bond formation protein DsbB
MLARLIIGLLLFSAVLCLAFSIATGQKRWRRLGLVIMKWTVVAALAFFAVLILERLALLL